MPVNLERLQDVSKEELVAGYQEQASTILEQADTIAKLKKHISTLEGFGSGQKDLSEVIAKLVDRIFELEKLITPLQANKKHPPKTSKTSSLPPSTDKKARRRKSKPGGAKPKHKPFFRTFSSNPDEVIEHGPDECRHCNKVFTDEDAKKIIGMLESLDLPIVKPIITHHHRLARICSGCGAKTKGDPLPDEIKGSPFGPGITAIAVYFKTLHLASYQRLQGMFSDLFGLKISEGALMNMIKRGSEKFAAPYEAALETVRKATAVASDETGVRIEGVNSWHWIFGCKDAIVHYPAFSRASAVVREVMAGHRPEYWLCDRYSAQQNHADKYQTCLAHLKRDVERIIEVGDKTLGRKLKKWFNDVFALAKDAGSMTREDIEKKREDLQNRIDKHLTWSKSCLTTSQLVIKLCNANNAGQLLTFLDAPDLVEPTNNASERGLRPSVINNKVTNGYRSMWGAQAACKIKTVVDTEKLKGQTAFQTLQQVLGPSA